MPLSCCSEAGTDLDSNVVAYTMNSNPPRPYRFKSTTLNFQVPGFRSLPRLLQNTKFVRDMSDSDTWKTAMRIFHTLRTWSRRTIWGDRVRSDRHCTAYTATLTLHSAIPSIRRPSHTSRPIPWSSDQRHHVRAGSE